MLAEAQDGKIGRPWPTRGSVNVAVFRSREQVDSALRATMHDLPRDQRLAFWRATYNSDVLATQFELRAMFLICRMSRNPHFQVPKLILVQPIAQNAVRSTMLVNHWVQACDVLARMVVARREANSVLSLFVSGPHIRASVPMNAVSTASENRAGRYCSRCGRRHADRTCDRALIQSQRPHNRLRRSPASEGSSEVAYCLSDMRQNYTVLALSRWVGKCDELWESTCPA